MNDSFETGASTAAGTPSASDVVPAATNTASDWVENFPAVNTLEWGEMNLRRYELIQRKIRGELTPAERFEYEQLQEKARQAVNAAFPFDSIVPAVPPRDGASS